MIHFAAIYLSKSLQFNRAEETTTGPRHLPLSGVCVLKSSHH